MCCQSDIQHLEQYSDTRSWGTEVSTMISRRAEARDYIFNSFSS